jgi:hypothetical protein
MPLDISRQILGPFGRLVRPQHRIDDALFPYIGDYDARHDAADDVIRTLAAHYPNAIISGSCFVIVPIQQAELFPPKDDTSALPKDAA